MNVRWAVAVYVLGVSAISAPARDHAENYAAPATLRREFIGTRPPEWTFGEWINSPPLKLAGLRGKLVLVRWLTAPGCQFCSASAGALNALWEEHRAASLVVVGAYHHKAERPFTREHVVAQAKRLGFKFPVAIDRDWATLERWWLGKVERGWTSATFLVGRDGTIRHVHGGGAYFEGEPGLAALRAAIIAALDEQTSF